MVTFNSSEGLLVGHRCVTDSLWDSVQAILLAQRPHGPWISCQVLLEDERIISIKLIQHKEAWSALTSPGRCCADLWPVKPQWLQSIPWLPLCSQHRLNCFRLLAGLWQLYPGPGFVCKCSPPVSNELHLSILFRLWSLVMFLHLYLPHSLPSFYIPSWMQLLQQQAVPSLLMQGVNGLLLQDVEPPEQDWDH